MYVCLSQIVSMLPFKKILVLINYNINSETVIKKIAAFADNPALELHFIFVIPYFSWKTILGFKQSVNKHFKNKRMLQKKIEADIVLNEIQTVVFKTYPDIAVYTGVLIDGAINPALVQYIHENQIDLVLSIRQSLKNLHYSAGINHNYIVQNANCPVLSVNGGFLQQNIKSILIPVYSFLPDKKIELASAFARQYNAQIYIITILNDNEEQSKVIADVFYLTYKRLKDEGFNPHYKMLSGANAPDILVQYAQQINADMILINPEKNKKENSFIKRSLNNFLSPVSPLQVLMMQSNI